MPAHALQERDELQQTLNEAREKSESDLQRIAELESEVETLQADAHKAARAWKHEKILLEQVCKFAPARHLKPRTVNVL